MDGKGQKEESRSNYTSQKDVEDYLKSHPSFADDYFVRNATAECVNSWLETHSFQTLESVTGRGPSQDASGRSPFRRNKSVATTTSELARVRPKKVCAKVEPKELNEKDVFMALIRDIANELDIDTLSHKILLNISMLTNGDRCSLFLARGSKEKPYLVSRLFDVNENSTLEESMHSEREEIRVHFGQGIAGYVANSKETLNIKDAYKDPRFNAEIDKKTGYRTHSILCMPVFSYEGEVVGVSQIINKMSGDHEFTARDEEVFRNYLIFCGIGIKNAQLFEMSVNEYKRNQLLLHLARGIFAEQTSLDKTLHKIMTEAIGLLKCERCLVFLLENSELLDIPIPIRVHSLEENSDANDLAKNVSKVFDLIKNQEVKMASKETTDWASDNGIAKYVALTGQKINIEDASTDKRFPITPEPKTEFMVRSLLCMPIYNTDNHIIGVAQLLNKTDMHPFNELDENNFEAFAIFCGLSIHNTQMYENACKLVAKQTVSLELLSFHATAHPQEVQRIMEFPVPSAENLQLYNFTFNDLPLNEDETVASVIRMFTECDFINKFRIPYGVMYQWLMTVKKNYRPVIYHNWRHALNVTQTMFAMFTTGEMKKYMSDLEMFALLAACLCHDLDHRGTNNAFQVMTETPLAQLYCTSTMEHHHFDHCIMILNGKGNNIFQSLEEKDYRNCMKFLELAILSTDLALYFKKRGQFKKLVEEGERAWVDEPNKEILRGMMMTACDVAAITKPWEIQKVVAELVASEFFEQGDIEKKKFHKTNDMMDRDKKDELPKMQVGFIDAICVPVYEMFADLFPATSPMYQGTITNRQHWQELASPTEECESLQ